MDLSCRHDLAHELVFLVTGRLEGPRRKAVEEHLRACADCRRRRETLAALRAAVREALDHVDTTLLVRHAEGKHSRPPLSPAERHAVEAHLTACAACREDLERVRAVQSDLRRPRPRLRTTWALAAVVLLGLALPASLWLARRPAPDLSPSQTLSLTAERQVGERPRLVLPREGPLVLEARIPAREGEALRYRAHLEDGGGTVVWRSGDLLPVDRYGTFSLIIDGLHAGSWTLVLEESDGQGNRETYRRSFALIAGP
jgi:hypothetical protein